MQYFNSITFNGFTFSNDKPFVLTNQKHNSEIIPPWEKSIYKFISELTNEKDYILAQSSGTTGKPKQIKLLKTELVESALRTKKYFNLKAGDKALLCLPASYIAGKMMIARAFVIGLDLHYVEPSSKPFQNLNTDIDFAAITPHQLFESLGDLNNSAIKNIIVGGAPMPSKLLEIIQDLKTNIYETYGMTETCSHIAIKPLNGNNKSEYFLVLPGFTVSTDERDCLVIRSQNNEVFKTNDIVELKENKFKWLGRFDNVINTGGIKLFPEQIEKKLEQRIKQRVIIASENSVKLGEQVILVMESKSKKNDYSGLKDAMNGVLSFYERPKKLYLLSDFIETTNGKVKRKETIELAKRMVAYDL